jgi:hypothetical protein
VCRPNESDRCAAAAAVAAAAAASAEEIGGPKHGEEAKERSRPEAIARRGVEHEEEEEVIEDVDIVESARLGRLELRLNASATV